MLAFADAAEAALRELDAFNDLLVGTDRSPMTRCEGWDVDALARHVAAVAWQQAEALHRARLGITQAPSYVEVGGDDLVAAVETSAAHLRSAIEQLVVATDPIVPLPFASLPASFAIQVVLIEYGFHRNDLEHALGDDRRPSPDVAATLIELLGAFLGGIQGAKPETDVAYRIVPDEGPVTQIAWHDGAWHAGEDLGDDTCELKGSASALALFAMGRITASAEGLGVRDPKGIVGRFKEFFPGP